MSPRANQAFRRGALDQAIVYYQRALADRTMPTKQKAVVNYNLGNLYLRLGGNYSQKSANEKKALQAYTLALTFDPGYAKAYNNRGNLYRLRGGLNSALRDYNNAIKFDPKYAAAWRNRSIVYEKRDRLGEALSDSKTYLRLKPNDSREKKRLARLEKKLAEQQKKAPRAMGFVQAGQAAMQQKKYKEALDNFHEALLLNALSPFAASRTYANQGTCWYRLGHYKKAAQSYRLALITDPQFAGAYRDRGIANLRLKNYSQAASDFTSAIKRDANLASAYYHRALAYWSLKRFAQAQKDMTHYIKMQPNDKRAQRILKLITARQPANYQ